MKILAYQLTKQDFIDAAHKLCLYKVTIMDIERVWDAHKRAEMEFGGDIELDTRDVAQMLFNAYVAVRPINN